MSEQQRATTIEGGYADDFSQGERLRSTTSPVWFFFIEGQVVAKRQSSLPGQISPVSLLRAYVIDPSSALIGVGASLDTITDDFLLPVEPTDPLERRPASRHERYARLIALIESWLADTSGYDEEAWPRLKARIEESRTSTRKRFSE